MEDYPIPKPKPLLEEIRVVRQGMKARLDAERVLRRERARESLMAGNRRFWDAEMAERNALVGAHAEAQKQEAPENG